MRFSLPPLATVQYRDVLASLGHNTAHGSFRVVTSEPRWGSIVRNDTGDATFVASQDVID